MDDATRERELSCWLALARGPSTPTSLLTQIAGDRRRIIALLSGAVAVPDGYGGMALRRYLGAPDWAGVDADLRWLQGGTGSVITFSDARYPELLRQIADAPPVLFVRGKAELLARHQVAVVGTRKPTPDGVADAYRLAADLVRAGVVVTSGLALGIDASAHAGALDAGGATIAVLGCGVDRAYPRRNEALADRIAFHGTLVSEFGPGTPPLAEHFPRRNRLISGLALGTLVVEAAMRSGSLITAGLAAAQGREVFALPGSIRNPMTQGCHHLIRQGAKLVIDVRDILEEFRELAPPADAVEIATPCVMQDTTGLDERCRVLLDNIGFGPVAMDDLVNQTGLAAGITASLLSSLEISGHVEILPGGRIIRR